MDVSFLFSLSILLCQLLGSPIPILLILLPQIVLSLLKSCLRLKKVEFGGSEQNKLQFTMSNLSSNIQNIEASRSSIEDADFAAEAADLAKNQILAQSATAMLAQASAIWQNILGLCR